MEVSSAFVVVMGMGVTFVGLTCIIFLTCLLYTSDAADE